MTNFVQVQSIFCFLGVATWLYNLAIVFFVRWSDVVSASRAFTAWSYAYKS